MLWGNGSPLAQGRQWPGSCQGHSSTFAASASTSECNCRDPTSPRTIRTADPRPCHSRPLYRPPRNRGVGLTSLLSDVGSAAALVVSAYSLYQTTLKRAAIQVFVSPVIRYASPYQNSNFEAFAVPVTLTNEGARSGIIMSMDLQVRAPERDVIKRFYSADIGQWSIEKNRTGDFRPFAPMVLAGRTSHTETILFHA